MLVIYYTDRQNSVIGYHAVPESKTEDDVRKFVCNFNSVHYEKRSAHFVNLAPGSFEEFLFNELSARKEFEKELAQRIIEKEPTIVTEILAKLGK